jgi:hypothetical protein
MYGDRLALKTYVKEKYGSPRMGHLVHGPHSLTFLFY